MARLTSSNGSARPQKLGTGFQLIHIPTRDIREHLGNRNQAPRLANVRRRCCIIYGARQPTGASPDRLYLLDIDRFPVNVQHA